MIIEDSGLPVYHYYALLPYCQHYSDLFEDVRHFEAFKFLQLGMLSEMPRKSLPEIAKIVGLKDSQSLHHFLRDSLWDVKAVREMRLWLTKLFIGEREIILCIDETGDPKKGKSTAYVTRQYIGNLGKIENGIVESICLWGSRGDYLSLDFSNI